MYRDFHQRFFKNYVERRTVSLRQLSFLFITTGLIIFVCYAVFFRHAKCFIIKSVKTELQT